MRTTIIDYMLSVGVTILRITEDEYSEDETKRFSWWVAHSFTPATTKGVESTDFNSVNGIEITDFVNTYHHELNKTKLVERFQTYIQEASDTIMEFSHLIKWKKYIKI